jgi:hypothetical protein
MLFERTEEGARRVVPDASTPLAVTVDDVGERSFDKADRLGNRPEPIAEESRKAWVPR